MNTHWIICFSITIKTSDCVLLKLILFSHSSLQSYSFIINRHKLVLQLSTNHSSVRIIVICTASLDRCKRQRDTLRQNVETISEGPLPNSLLWDYKMDMFSRHLGYCEGGGDCSAASSNTPRPLFVSAKSRGEGGILLYSERTNTNMSL